MLAVGVAAIVGAALVAAPAASHTELRGSDPEEGSQVEILEQVRLEFSSALLDIGSELVLVDADGAQHELTPEFPEGENAVVAPVDAQQVAAGDVVLNWRIVAEDGHPIEGEIAFAYTPVVVEEPAAESEETPEAAPIDETPEAVAEPEPTDETTPVSVEVEEDEPGSNAVWAWVLIGLALVGLAATAIVMAKRRDDA